MSRLPPALIILAAIALPHGCRRAEVPAPPAASRVVNVRLAPVELSAAVPAVRVAGLLARKTEVDLSFPIAGVIGEVNVRAGDRVRRGQELARLQSDAVEAQLTQARTAVEKTKRDLARVERLQAERVATLENLQDARTAVEQAEAGLRAAEFSHRHAVIRAPDDGVVLRRLAEPNESIPAGRPVLAYAGEGDGWIARAGVAARTLGSIAPGARAEVSDPSGHTVAATVSRIGEAADTATRTIPVEILLASPLPAARSGLIVSLVLTPPPVAERPVVPLAALREGAGAQASVFVLDAGARAVRNVSVDIEQVDGDRVYLRTALPAGARVVVSGGQFLADGTAVNPVD